MIFFKKVYRITGWNGNTSSLTAKELFDRVLEDSKSDYNWIASATELVKVCNNPSFPEMYAIGIKMIVLNCFANLELRQEYPSRREPTDNSAVYSCYHSLPSTDETVRKVKEKYLTAVITGITKYNKFEVRFPLHVEETYKKKVRKWIQAKFDEYVSVVEIDFEQLREDLYVDFDKMMKSRKMKKLLKKTMKNTVKN